MADEEKNVVRDHCQLTAHPCFDIRCKDNCIGWELVKAIKNMNGGDLGIMASAYQSLFTGLSQEQITAIFRMSETPYVSPKETETINTLLADFFENHNLT